MSKSIKCPLCEETFMIIEDLYLHLDEEHTGSIPKNFTPKQYMYMLKTGKTEGKCVIDHAPTRWNEVTGKYNRFCDKPKCKQVYIEMFRSRMIGKYGKVNLLNDPDHQKKMLANRKISGTYTWTNGTKTPYTGKYELDFLKFLDILMEFDPSDVIAPSPHTYYYEYNGERKFYFPDFFIPSLNLEIEIKDGGDNPNNHHKIQNVDKIKEKLKDEVLMSQSQFSYIKLVNKNYEPFFDFLMRRKAEFIKGDNTESRPIFIIKEGFEGKRIQWETNSGEKYEGVVYEEEDDILHVRLNDGKEIACDPKGVQIISEEVSEEFIRSIETGNIYKKCIPCQKLLIVPSDTEICPFCHWDKLRYPSYDEVINYICKAELEPEGDKNLSYTKEDETSVLTEKYDSVFLIRNLDKFVKNRVDYFSVISTFKFIRKDTLKLVDNALREEDLNIIQKDHENIKKYLDKVANSQKELKDACEQQKEWIDKELMPAIERKRRHVKRVVKETANLLEEDFNDFIKKIRTPEQLSQWMKSNIKCGNSNEKTWKLKSPKELYRTHVGQCYDQSYFEYYILNKMDLHPKMFYLMHFKANSNNGGNTHLFVIYRKNEKYYYFENAWGDFAGIHGPFNSEEEIKNLVVKNTKNMNSKKNFNTLYLTPISISDIKDNMSFDEFIDNAHKNMDNDKYFINLKESIEDVEEIEIVDEGALSLELRNLHRIFYNSMQDVTRTGNFHKIQPNLLKMAKSCKTMSEINYLRRDKNTGKRILERLAQNKPALAQKCRDHIKWLDTTYTEALNERAKEIRKSVKETVEVILEESNPQTEYKPIFVVMTNTGSPLGKIIKFVTGEPYNHVSLSLDTSLQKMYSFGTKRTDKISLAGFSIEAYNDKVYSKIPNTTFSMYVMFVPTNLFETLQNKLLQLEKDFEKYTFNILGLIGYAVNKPIHSSHAFFCSEFVDWVLRSVGIQTFNRDSGLVSPYAFSRLKQFHFVQKGKLNKYDEKKANQRVKQLYDSIFNKKAVNESIVIPENLMNLIDIEFIEEQIKFDITQNPLCVSTLYEQIIIHKNKLDELSSYRESIDNEEDIDKKLDLMEKNDYKFEKEIVEELDKIYSKYQYYSILKDVEPVIDGCIITLGTPKGQSTRVKYPELIPARR